MDKPIVVNYSDFTRREGAAIAGGNVAPNRGAAIAGGNVAPHRGAAIAGGNVAPHRGVAFGPDRSVTIRGES